MPSAWWTLLLWMAVVILLLAVIASGFYLWFYSLSPALT